MKILSSAQIKAVDAYTIENEPISSINLMERASMRFVDWYITRFNVDLPVKIFCGMGNNGGDGLAIARLLHQKGYNVEVFVIRHAEKSTDDFHENEKRFLSIKPIHDIRTEKDIPQVFEKDVVIDAIFGIGLTRTVRGISAQVIDYLNECFCFAKISVDIASGLMADVHSEEGHYSIFKPDFTVTFQTPKLAFMLPQNEMYVGEWELLPIGLSEKKMEEEPTSYFYTTENTIKKIIKKRKKFSHKGSFGHVLLMGGSYGKMGAIVLATKAALRAGVGLATAYVPRCGYNILQSTVPEAMCLTDSYENHISETPDVERFDAVAVGIGMDILSKPWHALSELLQISHRPLVIDADAINLMSIHPELIDKLPENSILTPHPKEFERLIGATANHFERLKLLKTFSMTHKVIVVLKGAHSAIALPNGNIHFNSTGNPGMATAGSGDVLTGIIVALLGQGYSPSEAAILGVYLHGLAGDIAAKQHSQPSMLATDITDAIGKAYLELLKE
ncbi:MAG: bifunctional ADP-dependent NAD(P)H-hydrate dehydratase/NAD(P)H-hydrate epimerase [Flammeovirgaceae bacterium]